ncbi:amino acid deaminase/aldolase [Fodinicola acaciae]|uniref:amino acid deaminase/aldolase n=1 Tax=Fodinicola acaciae TaxID=2681555 RepID=UPI0013D03106|nr:amino acid deaminase/aldolase [Fodinicola acaciae]
MTETGVRRVPHLTRAALDVATAGLAPPFAVVDLPSLRANAADLVRRAAGRPIRVASKSVRCREILRQVLAMDGFAGILSYSLAESLWLAEDFDDVVVAYPTTDAESLRRLASDARLAARVTLMVDSVEHLDLIDAAIAGVSGPPLRLCLDLDASLRLAGGRVHLGTRRSPVHSVASAVSLARRIVQRSRFLLVGIMSYEGQIAGLGDRPAGNPLRGLAIRAVQAASAAELFHRRAAVVAAVSALADLEFVNGGGTGSVERTVRESAITEVAAGSGLYAPRLFDEYRAFTPYPAALFALAVTRRPAPGIVTVGGAGWIASGPQLPNRVPAPVFPAGLRMIPSEGAGEVQTPLRGAAADSLRVGERVWFRHGKAGELCEHVNELHLIDNGTVVAVAPTYRGEGKAFG